MRRFLVPLVLLLIFVFAPLAAAEDDSLATAVRDLMAARGDEAVTAAVEALKALEVEPAKLVQAFADGRPDPDRGDPGWRVKSISYPDGKKRPYHLYVPERYDPDQATPVLIHMHGGVSRPEMIPEKGMEGYRDWWTEQADEWGFLVVFPLGQNGAEWWTENGAGGVHLILTDLKRGLNVDEDRVFATGFSDGGSGAFYLAMTHPTFFAGFIPLNGHPAVASGASGRQLYPRNMVNRPLYVVNTQDDQLYPAASILPYLEALMKANVAVRFTSYPGIGHNPAYRDEQNPLIAKFMADTARDPLPARLSFETADLEINRMSWLTILEFGETKNAPDFKDVNVMMPGGRVRIGVQIDTAFEGVGTRVDSVVEGSVAEAVGLLAGDVIVGIDEAPITDMNALRGALGKKTYGDKVRITFKRGEAELSGEGEFPAYTPQPTFGRKNPSGRVDISAEGNVITVLARGVKSFALDLSPDLFDLEQEVVVTLNGTEAFRGKVEFDRAHLLQSFARDRDRQMLFTGRIVITAD
jgi:predicted esterase